MPDDPAPQGRSPIEIVSDEDWKTRVKAEDAKLDAENAGQGTAPPAAARPADIPAEEAADSSAPSDYQLPAASFAALLQMLSTQAIAALGMIPGPDGQSHVELPVARHFIDLLAVLETKCQGNLTADEAAFLEGTLHELRMAYVAASRQA